MIHGAAASITADQLRKLAASREIISILPDGPVESTSIQAGKGPGDKGGDPTFPPPNYYIDTLNVRPLWDAGLKGQGIGVAVIDSGISSSPDITNLVVKEKMNSQALSNADQYGHGTHVAGIIAGNGTLSGGHYLGIAPGVNLLSLKINNDVGMAYESDTVAAMQWVLNNKATYNIRVVNLSVNSTVVQSYHQSPLNAAAEILWFNGVVVVVSSGNKSLENGFNPVLAAPANDPFVITVGASDEKGSGARNNDSIADFTAYDTTIDGFLKPEIVAPGKDIYSLLSSPSSLAGQYPDRVVAFNGTNAYFRMSGTSMAAPMVTSAVALLLQDEPTLTPDQVKYRLMATAGSVGKARYLDIQAAVQGTTTQSANTGLAASQLLWGGTNPVAWNSVNWNSVNWNSVNWNSVNWNSVNWNSVNWNSTYWGN